MNSVSWRPICTEGVWIFNSTQQGMEDSETASFSGNRSFWDRLSMRRPGTPFLKGLPSTFWLFLLQRSGRMWCRDRLGNKLTWCLDHAWWRERSILKTLSLICPLFSSPALEGYTGVYTFEGCTCPPETNITGMSVTKQDSVWESETMLESWWSQHTPVREEKGLTPSFLHPEGD